MGDTERVWLNYEEAGKALGIKPASAKRLSFRCHWPHRAGNDGLARIGVPVTELPRVSDGDTGDATGDMRRGTPGGDSGTASGDKPDASAALALALDRIEALAGRVGHAQAEVERLRAELATAEVAAGQVEELRNAVLVAEGTVADAQRRAEDAERAAVEAWGIARDLAARLAAVQAPVAPAQPSPTPPRGVSGSDGPRGLLGWLLRR